MQVGKDKRTLARRLFDASICATWWAASMLALIVWNMQTMGSTFGATFGATLAAHLPLILGGLVGVTIPVFVWLPQSSIKSAVRDIVARQSD